MDNGPSSNNGYSIISGFNEEPQNDGRNLAALFGGDENPENQYVSELDFRYDPSSIREPEPIIPKPRVRRYSGPSSSEISLGEPIPVDFKEFNTRTVYLSVVNGEVLRFDDVVDGSMLCSISFASCRLSTIGNVIAICVGNDIHSRFLADFDIYTKLCAIISARHVIEPLVFSNGDGDDEGVENAHILFSQLTFNFSKNELKELPEQTTNSKHLKLKAKRLSEDPFFKEFKGKRPGAKFIVAIDGTGICFELKRLKMKSSPYEDFSRHVTPPPLPIEEAVSSASSTIHTRMSKIGRIQLLPTEIVKPKPQEIEVNPNPDDATPEPPPRSSPSPVESVKPVPAERKASLRRDDFEKRFSELETKVEKLLTNPSPNTSNAAPSTDRYEFAMDIWGKIVASSTIPSEAKPEIKKLLISAAIEL